MSSTERNFYYFSLEGIRGIAAILIAIRHLDLFFNPIKSYTSFLAVDLFFLLSGFVISENYESKIRLKNISSKEFIILRLIRIYPLYIVCSVIGCILLVYHSGKFGIDTFSTIAESITFFPDIFSTTTLYPLDPPAWSLFAELAMCIVYGFWASRASNSTVAAIALLSGCLLLIGICMHGSADIGFQRKWFVFGLFRIGFSFSIGVLIFRNKNKLCNLIPTLNNKLTVLMFSIVLLLLLAPIQQNSKISVLYSLIVVFILFPLTITFSVRCQPTGIVKKTAAWLGRLSFPLYVFHVPMGDAISTLAKDFFSKDLALSAPWIGPFVLILISALALLESIYLDEPFRRYLKSKLLSKNSVSKLEIRAQPS